MSHEIFTETFLNDINEGSTIFDVLMDIYRSKKQRATFEKFNVYGKFSEDRPVKKVKSGDIYVYRGSSITMTDVGHKKIVTSFKKAKLLTKVGKSEMAVNIQMVELIAKILKKNSEIADYNVPLFVEPKPAPRSKRK